DRTGHLPLLEGVSSRVCSHRPFGICLRATGVPVPLHHGLSTCPALLTPQPGPLEIGPGELTVLPSRERRNGFQHGSRCSGSGVYRGGFDPGPPHPPRPPP